MAVPAPGWHADRAQAVVLAYQTGLVEPREGDPRPSGRRRRAQRPPADDPA